jgi:uncharacterized OB-fold protein
VSLPLQACIACGRRAFPARLLCPCGGRSFRTEDAERGMIEEITSLRRVPGRALAEPVRIATVAVGDVRVIARLEREAEPGAEAALSLDGGAPVAR